MGTRMGRFLGRLHELVFTESDDPWAAEVIGYTQGGVAVAAAVGLHFGLHASAVASIGAGGALFLVLRLLLASRFTAWIAGLVGTSFALGVGAALGWAFGQVLEVAGAPLAGAACLGVACAGLPAYAYVRYVLRSVVRPSGDAPDSMSPAPSSASGAPSRP